LLLAFITPVNKDYQIAVYWKKWGRWTELLVGGGVRVQSLRKLWAVSGFLTEQAEMSAFWHNQTNRNCRWI